MKTPKRQPDPAPEHTVHDDVTNPLHGPLREQYDEILKLIKAVRWDDDAQPEQVYVEILHIDVHNYLESLKLAEKQLARKLEKTKRKLLELTSKKA